MSLHGTRGNHNCDNFNNKAVSAGCDTTLSPNACTHATTQYMQTPTHRIGHLNFLLRESWTLGLKDLYVMAFHLLSLV